MDALIEHFERAQQELVNLDPKSPERQRLNLVITLIMEQIAELRYKEQYNY